MKLIKYVCQDCRGERDLEFYTPLDFDYENPFCPNCGGDKFITNKGEVDAKEL
jgi:Zn finger protein HypA/HybF involved in hydrogenase expression